jgi:hypothetical protein
MAAKPLLSKHAGLWTARILASLMALAMGVMGGHAIFSGYYYGSTAKLGGAEVELAGTDAQLMGLLYLLLGAMASAVWFRTPRAAALWASMCAVALLVLLTSWLYG